MIERHKNDTSIYYYVNYDMSYRRLEGARMAADVRLRCTREERGEMGMNVGFRGLLFSAGLFLGALAVGPAAAEEPQRGGVITAVYGAETQALFAPGGGGGNPLLVSSKILERLVRLEADLSFSGQLAESWTGSADGLSYTFKLRRNVTWHDGKPFTAADIVFNAKDHWRVVAGNPALRGIKDAHAADDYTVTIEFNSPTPESLILATLAGPEAQVIAKHLYEGTELQNNPLNNTPIGTGPFKYVEWVRGSHVELARNENYWDAGLPYLDKIFIRYLQEPSARANAFEVGEVNLGVGSPFPPADMQRFIDAGTYDVTDRGGIQEFMVMEMNNRKPILSDVRVRRAIAHAIDQQFVADVLVNGFARPAVGPVSDVYTTVFNPDVARYEFDPDKARQLLDEAGYPGEGGKPRFELKVVAGPWYAENGRMASYVKQALEEVGISVKLETPDRAGALRMIYQEYDFDLSISNNTSYVDPLMRSIVPYTTVNITGTPFRNSSGYSNPKLDAIVDQAAVELDPAKRVDLLKQFQAIALEDLPVRVMVYKRNMTLAHGNVRNHASRPEWIFDSWKDVWIAK
jgi:ABC-type dipeptide transport system, periplasmic component